MQENKSKIIKIYFCIFNEHLKCGKRMKKIWNTIVRIKLSRNLTLMHKINYLLSKQMSMSTHNNTQTLIPRQMSLNLFINHHFIDQYK